MLLIYSVQGVSYAQVGNPTITATTTAPLTEATLHESVVTITLNNRKFARSIFDIRDAVSVSGIDGVTIPWHDPDRESDTVITIELEFNGDFDTDAVLTFTVGADAIANYNGPALTAQVPVTGLQESITASTPQPLTEETLNGSVVTLTLSGGVYEKFRWDIADALTVSGIPGVTIGQSAPSWFAVKRPSDTEITVELGFDGDIDTDATLTFTVGSGAIENYNGAALTAEVTVTAEVANETNTEQSEEIPRFCQVGDVIAPGESCTYVTEGKNIVFSVNENGKACREGGPITRVVLGLNVVVQNLEFCVDYDIEQDETFNSNFAARKNSDSSWTIDTVPAETPANVPAVVPEDVDDGSIDTEETTEIDPKPITPIETPSPVISFHLPL